MWCWVMRPTRTPEVREEPATPPTVRSHESSPARSFSKVDLPLPLRPTTATRLSAETCESCRPAPV
eukprot:6151434-Pyramimonas_sp.AAC.1